MSVQTQISRITAAVGAAYDAVTAKGGTTPQAETVAGLADAISTIPTGGGSAPGAPGDITFYDYDGTIVTSWTLEELATKTALPDYPSHEGLTCQGWNWSLADLKTTNRKMNVGAMYITDDGKTRIYIRLEEGRTSPMLGVCPNGTVTVDWGDGTTTDTLTGTSTSTVKWTPNHAYASPGEYVIKLSVDGAMGFYGSANTNQYSAILRYSANADTRNYAYRNSVQRVEIGESATIIGSNAFYYCYSLASITIPSSVTSIGSSAFYYCYSLASVTIPDIVTSIGNRVFQNCFALASITIPNSVTIIGGNALSVCYTLNSVTIPSSVTSIGESAFSYCYTLNSITIPSSVTSIGPTAFVGCYALHSIIIPSSVTSIERYTFQYCNALNSVTIPSSVTSIGESAFVGCYALHSIIIPSSVTSIGKSAFENCYALHSIIIPSSVTSIGKSAFRFCYSLSSITIPDGVTSIEETTLNGCYTIASIMIPSSVTSIGVSAFYNCNCIAFYDFTNHTSVPTLSNTNAFTGIAADCEIRVPAALADEWKAATNWATYADHIVGV